MRYWAHSDPNGLPPDTPGSMWQPLCVHLENTAALAESFAAVAAPGNRFFAAQARKVGLLHDIGKYTPGFQRLLRGEIKKAPHSAHGAGFAAEIRQADLAYAIAGHHAGLPNGDDLKVRIAEVRAALTELKQLAVSDCPAISDALVVAPPAYASLGLVPGPRLDMWIRMLFSCLIDADRTDTAANAGDAPLPSIPLNPEQRLAKLLAFVQEKANASHEGPVKTARAHVLNQCLLSAANPSRLFSLTVPTGGGKTLAAMAFALKRALLRPAEVRRIVVVIPYLSIIEQNAAVYRNALGDDAVLEHHSGDSSQDSDVAYSNPSRRAAFENWDAPVVVTTSVRFFESLFSNRPSALRRAHNLARSVVILDEVQTLPRQFVGPILSMMDSLSRDWNTCFLYSTATQPAFEKTTSAEFAPSKRDHRWSAGKLTEIIPDPPSLFQLLERVRVEWPRPQDSMPWADLAQRLDGERQALVIVNTRDQAAQLFRTLRARRNQDVYHLSTRLCPIHRLRRIRRMRDLLQAAQPCVLVSTQLVEAGVDLDFPLVFRAMGPLDSIAQAAGRCDREGRLTQSLGFPAGRVVVFVPEDGKMPPGAYSEAAGITASMAAQGEIQLNDLVAMRRYFDRYYDADLDPSGIEPLRAKGKFKDIDAAFAMIDDQTESVVVPCEDAARRLLQQAKFAGYSLRIRRSLQVYTVNLFRHTDFLRARNLGIVSELIPDTGLWTAKDGFYHPDLGLVLDPVSEAFVV